VAFGDVNFKTFSNGVS